MESFVARFQLSLLVETVWWESTNINSIKVAHWGHLLSKSGWILINSYTSRASIGKVSSAIRFILLIGGVHCVGVGAFSRKVTRWMRPLCRCRGFFKESYTLVASTM